MNHQYYMNIALKEAKKAQKKDEVPIGAVVVDPKTGEVIAKAHNLTEYGKNALAHAEIEVMQKACKKMGQKRLWDMYLYVTLEPCTMCAGAISMMRIKKLVYGAKDEKGGGVDSGIKFFATKTCHHKPEVEAGILQEECSQILKDFFKQKRQKNFLSN